jgi:hypothetical protein
MSQQFRRVVNVTVAPAGEAGALAAISSTMGFDISNLDCEFRVRKSLKAEPNTCELRVFNLAQNTRRVLENAKRLVLRLEAGYPEAVAQLYLGEVRSAQSFRDGSDIITEISSGDSEKELAESRLSLTVGPKVPSQVALTAIARSLGVGLGNVAKASAALAAKGSAFFGSGTALYGHSAKLLDDFCRSADLEWSIQDGVLQILDRGAALEDKAVYLSADTGLVGTPTIDNKGILSVTALIQPDLRPGRKIVLEAQALRGTFRIQDVEYIGATAGQEWYAQMSCSRPS